MLTLKCLGTGSQQGNCYLLAHNDEVIILDAGIPIKAIKRGLNWQLGGIQGVLITHGHHDHDLSVKDFRNMGLSVWRPYLDGTKSQFHQFGGFSVQSFAVPHDNEPCVGYYIEVAGHRILYAMDFEYLPMSFKNMRITDMLVECNHQKELVDRNEAKYSHQIRGHCSLETLIDKVIKENMTNALRNIILCHYSGDSCDIEECVAEVRKVAGNANVSVARAGEICNLDLVPF